MSKQTNSDGFGWDELWAAYRGQPNYIRAEWLLGLRESLENPNKRSPGLIYYLTEIMEKGSQKVKDEVFGDAPEEVQIFFKYKKVEVEQTKPVTFNSMNQKERLSYISRMFK